MMEFMRAGGIGTWVVLVFGLITLGAAAVLLFRPTARRLALVRGLSVATCFSVLSGVTAGFAAVMSKVPASPKWARSPDMPLIVMTGLGEALTVAILGFTILAIAWLMVAVGQRRLAGEV